MSDKNRRDASNIRDVNNKRDIKNRRKMSTTAGSQQQQERQQQQKRQWPQLNTAEKSATTRRQSTAGTSSVVDNGSKFATGVVDNVGKSWQIMAKISDCLHPIVNLKKKNVSTEVVNSTTRKCPNKIFINFLLKSFFPFANCQQDWCCTLSWE